MDAKKLPHSRSFTAFSFRGRWGSPGGFCFFVFFLKREMPPLVQKVLLGFALGFVLMMVLDVVLG